MSVRGDHAIADDLRALWQIGRQRDGDRLIVGVDGRIVAQLAGGVDQMDRPRRHLLVEAKLEPSSAPAPARRRRAGSLDASEACAERGSRRKADQQQQDRQARRQIRIKVSASA